MCVCVCCVAGLLCDLLWSVLTCARVYVCVLQGCCVICCGQILTRVCVCVAGLLCDLLWSDPDMCVCCRAAV